MNYILDYFVQNSKSAICIHPQLERLMLMIDSQATVPIVFKGLLMTSSARFELFSFWRTSATYRVRVAFNLKGVTPQDHNVNLDTGEQRGEAFLKVNPMGAIPALVDHGPGQS